MVQMTSKKWAIILFISIALNIFLGSVLVADKFFKEKRHTFRGMVYSVPWAVKVIGKEVRSWRGATGSARTGKRSSKAIPV